MTAVSVNFGLNENSLLFQHDQHPSDVPTRRKSGGSSEESVSCLSAGAEDRKSRQRDIVELRGEHRISWCDDPDASPTPRPVAKIIEVESHKHFNRLDDEEPTKACCTLM